MESLYLLIPMGIVFVIIAIKILFWAINSGQYDNLDTEAHRILFDDDATDGKTSTSGESSVAKDSAADDVAEPERKDSDQ